MILSAEEFTKLLNAFAKSEEFEELIKAIVDRRVAKALDQHLDEYEHKETEVAEEELAQ